MLMLMWRLSATYTYEARKPGIKELITEMAFTYTYEARKPGIKELITEMAFNGAGVRDTARTLKIGITYTYETHLHL
ncbi:Transposase [Shigella dysenteriae 1617]|uniref:Transposase n=1 Tax=Shigella dysenteriae 1617 TaxID=754093 RepID=A0A0A6ZSS8_SHIDY|nr:Transposase [Shigella dysenteriae 1617]